MESAKNWEEVFFSEYNATAPPVSEYPVFAGIASPCNFAVGRGAVAFDMFGMTTAGFWGKAQEVIKRSPSMEMDGLTSRVIYYLGPGVTHPVIKARVKALEAVPYLTVVTPTLVPL